MTAAKIDRNVERYMDKPYRVELTPAEEGGWFVRLPDLPYCMSQGETVEEAMMMIHDAQQAWLTAALQDGRPIPEPREPSYAEAEDEEYSGRFNIRLPRSLHRQLALAAEAEGVSLNLFAATILARAVGHANPQERKPGRPRRMDGETLPDAARNLLPAMVNAAPGPESDREIIYDRAKQVQEDRR